MIIKYCDQSKNYDIFIKYIEGQKDEKGLLSSLLEYLKKNSKGYDDHPSGEVTKPFAKG